MNDSNLSTTSGSGTQNTTQDPQSVGESTGSGTQSAKVQPGTTSTLLDNSTGGVPLQNQALSTVALPKVTASVAQPATPLNTTNSPVSTGFSILLFLIAGAVLLAIFLPAKNTTD
jgi:hypothetical protein